MLILRRMSKESLLEAVRLAGGQAHLAAGIRRRCPGSKVGQVHVWGWLNSVKMEVPPADVVLPIAEHLNYRLTPHDLRPDLYPNPTDALPLGMRIEIPEPQPPAQDIRPSRLVGEDVRQHDATLPVRALACATQSVRLTADRRDADRRDLVRRAEPVDAPQPNQLPLALASETHQEAA